MSIRILSAADVRAALPMSKAVDAMRHAYSQLSAGKAVAPPRQHISTDKGVTLIMPAYLPERSEFTLKVVSVYDDNPSLNLPRITATVLVLDPATGSPMAFMDGTSLTAIRTGAGGGVAADLLARQEAKTVGLFGAGVQARTQLQAAMAVRDITCVNLISRTQASAQQLAHEISEWTDAPEVKLVSTPQQVVADADIVLCATTSATPLFDGKRPTTRHAYHSRWDVRPRKTGSRYNDNTASRPNCGRFAGSLLEEAGDLIIPNAHIDAEIGEIVNGDKPGRQSENESHFLNL